MAIAMAREGGIGVLHRNLSLEDQAVQVDLVKRSESGMITNPITCSPDDTLRQVDALCGRYRISGVPVVDRRRCPGRHRHQPRHAVRHRRQRQGPRRDDARRRWSPRRSGSARTTALTLLQRHKVEKLPLVDDAGRLRGLITVKDFTKSEQYPDATKDDQGRLRVAAAVGVGDEAYKRARGLIEAGVDVIIVDTSHGHQRQVLDMIARMKKDTDHRHRRRQRGHVRGCQGDGRGRCGRGEGRCRTRRHLHHPDRGRGGRAADHRDHGGRPGLPRRPVCR